MNKEKCQKCFWNIASIETWADFEARPGQDRAEGIKHIVEIKCKQCKNGFDNFSEIWRCRKCGGIIDGHQYLLHGELCSGCWDIEVNGDEFITKKKVNNIE